MRINSFPAIRVTLARWRERSKFGTALFALVGDSLVYLIGSATIGLAGAVLLPLYTRHLAPDAFGAYALVDAALQVALIVLGMGFNVSYLRWYADDPDRPELLGSVLLFSMGVALVGGLALWAGLASPWGAALVQWPTGSFAWTVVPLAMLGVVINLFLTDLRARRAAVSFSVASLLRFVGMVSGAVWFLVVQKAGVAGVLYGRVAGDTLMAIVLSIVCMHRIRWQVIWRLIRPMLRFGLPLILGGLAMMLPNVSGRYFLSRYASLNEVGLYTAGTKVANLMQFLFIQPFGTAWGGLMFQIVKWEGARTIYSKIFTYTFVASMVIALLAALFAPALFALLTSPVYTPAIGIFPLLLFSLSLLAVQYPAAIGIYLGGKTYLFPTIFAAGLGANLAANRLLVPAYGMVGAAMAGVIGQGIILVLMAVLGQRYYSIRYELKSMAVIGLICLVAIVLARRFAPGLDFEDVALQIVLAASVLLSIGLFAWWDLSGMRARMGAYA